MSFTNFLYESKFGSKVSELKFIELLNEKARTSHDVVKKNPIYKLIKGGPDYMLFDPKKAPDKSSYWIDRITAELPAWKKLPLRTECLRAYSSYERSGDQPHSYVVIPLDHAQLGISSKASFYRSFADAQKAMGCDKLDNEGFSKWAKDLAATVSKLAEVDVGLNEMTTYKSVKLALTKIDRVLLPNKVKIQTALKKDDLDLEDESHRRIKDVLARHVTTLDLYLQEKLDPENNGFHAINVESLREYNDREIWISSPCLLVRREAYIDLHKRGEIK